MLKTNIIDTKYIGDDGRAKQLCIIEPDSTKDISLNSKDIVSAGSIKKLIEAIGPHTPEYDPTEINKRVYAVESEIRTLTNYVYVDENKDVNISQLNVGGITTANYGTRITVPGETDDIDIGLLGGQKPNKYQYYPILTAKGYNKPIVDAMGNVNCFSLNVKDQMHSYALIKAHGDLSVDGDTALGKAYISDVNTYELHPWSKDGISLYTKHDDESTSRIATLCGPKLKNDDAFPILSIAGRTMSIIDVNSNINAETIKASNIKCVYTTATTYLDVDSTSNFKGLITATGGIQIGMVSIQNGVGPSFNGMQCGMTSSGLIQTQGVYTNVITNGSTEKKAYLTDGTTAALPDTTAIEANITSLTSRVSALESNSSSGSSSSSDSATFDELTINGGSSGKIQFSNNTFKQCELPGRRDLNILQSTYIGYGPGGPESVDEYKSYFLYVDQPTYIKNLSVGSISNFSPSRLTGLYYIEPPTDKSLQIDGKLSVDGKSTFYNSISVYGTVTATNLAISSGGKTYQFDVTKAISLGILK